MKPILLLLLYEQQKKKEKLKIFLFRDKEI